MALSPVSLPEPGQGLLSLVPRLSHPFVLSCVCSLCPECSLALDTPGYGRCLHGWPLQEGRKGTRVMALSPRPALCPV